MGSPEFRLCVECCAASFAKSAVTLPESSIAGIDWAKLVRLARFHRVQGLVWNALGEHAVLSSPAGQELAQDARDIAANNLRAMAETQSLLQRFQESGISLLFLKGLPVGALAYVSPMLKSAVDLDLLVDPRDLDQAAELLRSTGYRLIAPTGNRRLHAWHKIWKESVWMKGSPPLQIDLHTRTANNPRLIPAIDMHSPRQSVHLADDLALPTLAEEELFAYLAVHGASSAWFRLKWISDFAAILPDKPCEIERLHRRSQELGAARAAGQALLLADTLFGSLGSVPELRADLSGDRPTRRLHRAATRLLMSGPSEPTARALGTLPIHWTQFELMPGAAYKLSELSGQIRRGAARLA